MNIALMRFVDGRIGPYICDLLASVKKLCGRRAAPCPPPKEIRTILVLKLWGCGSIVLATPMLRALKGIAPDSRIVFLTFAQNEEVCRMSAYIDEVQVISTESLFKWAASTVRAVRRIGGMRCDVGLNMEFFSTFAALLISALPVRFRMAFGGFSWSRRVLFDYLVSYENGVHISEKFINFAKVLDGGAGGDLRVERLRPPPGAVESAKGIMAQYAPSGSRIIVMNVNSSDMAPRRKWPLRHFTETAKWLLQQPGLVVFAIGAEGDRPYVEEFMSSLPPTDRVVNLAGRLTLYELTALLDGADLYFGNDSGPLQIAVSVGTRSLSIFGPETPLVYGPRDPDLHRILYLGLSCSPCLNIYSNKGARCCDNVCVSRIDPLLVQDEIKRILDRSEGMKKKRPAGAGPDP